MLDIDIWNFIWAIVNIVILFILLRIFLFKPINKIIDERTKSVQNDIDSAKKSMEEAEHLKSEYTETLANTKAEAQQIIMKAREEAAAVHKESLLNSQEEANKIIENANKTVENERKKAIQDAQSYVADLAIAAASKIIGENVDDEKNRKLVDEFLAEEGSKNND
jgi:F-type H+-transporting ATPase subunit b